MPKVDTLVLEVEGDLQRWVEPPWGVRGMLPREIYIFLDLFLMQSDNILAHKYL